MTAHFGAEQVEVGYDTDERRGRLITSREITSDPERVTNWHCQSIRELHGEQQPRQHRNRDASLDALAAPGKLRGLKTTYHILKGLPLESKRGCSGGGCNRSQEISSQYRIFQTYCYNSLYTIDILILDDSS